MKKNIGIIVPNLGTSQLSVYAISFANKLFKTEHDCCLFYRDLSAHCIDIKAGCMTISEVWGFKGTLISTCLYDTEFLLKSISSGKKIFYIWDLEFLRNNKDYIKNTSIYRNPDIILAARSQSHAKAIENYCNRPVDMIVEDFNFPLEEL
jgi:hypothetical protein